VFKGVNAELGEGDDDSNGLGLGLVTAKGLALGEADWLGGKIGDGDSDGFGVDGVLGEELELLTVASLAASAVQEKARSFGAALLSLIVKPDVVKLVTIYLMSPDKIDCSRAVCID